MMAVLVVALRRGPDAWRSWLLSWLALPPIVTFAVVSAWSSQRALFHWAAPGYLMLFPLLGDVVARRIAQPAVRRTLVGTGAFVVLCVAIVASQVRFGWLHATIVDIAPSDPTIQAVDWTSLGDGLPPGTLVGVPNWRDAGKIGYALGPHITTVCLSLDCREFGLTSPAHRFIGAGFLIFVPEHVDRAANNLARAFDRIERLPDRSIRQAGRTLQTVAVFRGDRLRAWPPP
jgi:hypothetical protein